MKRTAWIAIALLVALAMLLAQCGPTEAPPEPTQLPAAEPTEEVAPTEAPPAEEPAGEVTLTWGFWGSPEEKATHEKVAEAFMAENPNIKIEIWHQPWGDYFTKLQTLWAAGDAESIPDVLFLFPVPSYAADGVLENLNPFIEASRYDLEDYWPGVLETTSFEGHVYGFPRDIGLEVLYYNKDHFDEAGLDYPDDSWTWNEFQAAAEALTVVESSGRVSRYGLGMEGGKYFNFLLSNGGTILDDMFNPSRCGLADPESVEAITFVADLMNNEYAMRDANLNQAGGDMAVFQAEQVSMIVQNASRVPSFNAAGMNYDVAPVPMAPGGVRAAAGSGAAWTMNSHASSLLSSSCRPPMVGRRCISAPARSCRRRGLRQSRMRSWRVASHPRTGRPSSPWQRTRRPPSMAGSPTGTSSTAPCSVPSWPRSGPAPPTRLRPCHNFVKTWMVSS